MLSFNTEITFESTHRYFYVLTRMFSKKYKKRQVSLFKRPTAFQIMNLSQCMAFRTKQF